MSPYGKQSKFSISRCFLKTILYSFVSDSDTTTQLFPFDLSRIVEMQRCVVLQNHASESSEVCNFWIFNKSILYPSLSIWLYVFLWCGKRLKMHCFWATRHKFIDVLARAKIQLVNEVAQIIVCFYFWCIIYLFNVDCRICITLQHSLTQIPQVLEYFKSSLVGYISHVNILPPATFFSEYFTDSHVTSSFWNMRFVTSVPDLSRANKTLSLG